MVELASSVSATTGPRVGAVVLTYNSRNDIAECLASLSRSYAGPLDVLVVDNASTDDMAGWVAEHAPGALFVPVGANRGWSGGNNVGIRRALERGADWVWLLNPDVEVGPGCLDELIRFAAGHPAVGILSPVIYHYADRSRLWFAGGRIDTETCVSEHVRQIEEFQALAPDRRYVSGCALLARREVFERVGRIDERFFMYCEDGDFCRRAVRDGFGIEVVESARLYHKVSASTGGQETVHPFAAFQLFRSTLLFWRKYLGWVGFHRNFCRRHLGKWLLGLDVMYADPGRRERAQAILDALWSYLAGTSGAGPRRPCPEWFRRFVLRRPWLVAELMSFRFLSLLGMRQGAHA
jgi:GT2 family glycosyltransferase